MRPEVDQEAMLTSPYKGLAPYSENDAPFFFGREQWRDTIIANLQASRLTLLYGASGVGKSSVLRASVAPYLRRPQSPEFAVVVFNSWRDEPAASLRMQIEELLADELSEARFAKARESSSLYVFLEEIVRQTDYHLFIILDQFEEYFLYHPFEDREGSFEHEFPIAVNDSDLRVNFLISIREDAWSKLDRFKGRISNLFDNYLRLEYLNRAEARAAIEGPLDVYNRLCYPSEPIRIEQDLVEQVLEQVRVGGVAESPGGLGLIEAASGDAIETPYLQLVMASLWYEEMRARSGVLRVETLARLGGAKRLVLTQFDSAMGRLSPSQQAIGARIFQYLVTPTGAKIAQTAVDLCIYTGRSQEEVIPVLNVLSSQELRILRPIAPPPNQPEHPRYEIFHDALAQAILGWRQRYTQDRERQRAAKEAAAKEIQLRLEMQARLTRLLAGVSVALVILAVIAVVLSFQYNKQRNAAIKELEQRRITLSRQLASQSIENQKDQLDLSLLLGVAAYQSHPTAESMYSLSTALEANPYLQTFLRDHTGAVESVAFSPDGKILASASQDKKIIFWNPSSHKRLSNPTEFHTEPVLAVAVSPNGEMLASGGGDMSITLWRLKSDSSSNLEPQYRPLAKGLPYSKVVHPGGKAPTTEKPGQTPPIEVIGHTRSVTSLAFSPDNRILASASQDSSVILWDIPSRERIGFPLVGHKATVTSLAFSPDGKLLASASSDSTILVWDVASRQQVDKLTGHDGPVRSVAFSPDGKVLASGGLDGAICVWDITHQMPRRRLGKHTGGVLSVAFSPDGKVLASGGQDARIILWDALMLHPDVIELTGHADAILSLAFSPDGHTLASGSRDKTIILWEIKPATRLGTTIMDGVDANSVAFSLDGRILVSRKDESFSLLDITSGSYRMLINHRGVVLDTALSRDETLLAVGGKDGLVMISDIKSQHEPRRLSGHDLGVFSVEFSPNGKLLASAEEKAFIIWEVAAGKPLVAFKDNTKYVRSLAFSPDSEVLAVGYSNNTIGLWSTADFKQIEELNVPIEDVLSLAYSPDGKTLASGGHNMIILRDSLTHSLKKLEEVKNATFSKIAFSLDGKTLVSSIDDPGVDIMLWDVETHRLIGKLKGHGGAFSTAFGPNSKTLASVGRDKSVKQWDVSPTSWLKRACEIVNRNMTGDEWKQYMGNEPYREICPDLQSGLNVSQ